VKKLRRLSATEPQCLNSTKTFSKSGMFGLTSQVEALIEEIGKLLFFGTVMVEAPGIEPRFIAPNTLI
jgi:hypothetical protein